MMGDKPSKFEEDAAAFAAGIFKVADNAKAAGKLKKLDFKSWADFYYLMGARVRARFNGVLISAMYLHKLRL